MDITEMFDELFELFCLNDDYKYIKKRIERITVLLELDTETPRTATEICNKLRKYPLTRVSRTLIVLEGIEACTCINKEDLVNRKYVLTEKGVRFKKYLRKEEERRRKRENKEMEEDGNQVFQKEDQ